MFSEIINYLYIIPAALIAIILHEISHGLVSSWLGDPTPKRQGRLSLNPLKHLDLVGTLCLIVFHVGWAKPVVVNPEYYKNKKRGMALVALAGPVMNFIIAIVSIVIISLITAFATKETTFINIIFNFFTYLSIINLGLGIFNLIPIPPLDGSRIFGAFLSDAAYEMYMKIERYGFIIIAVLLVLSSLRGGGISIVSELVENIFMFFYKTFVRLFLLV
jgi:peptidase M50